MLQTFQKIALRNCLVSLKLSSKQCDCGITRDISRDIFNNTLFCVSFANGHLKAIFETSKADIHLSEFQTTHRKIMFSIYF